MPKMREVYVRQHTVARVSDVMQLILRLPYSEAMRLAVAIQGDVRMMTTAAKAWLDADTDDTETDGDG